MAVQMNLNMQIVILCLLRASCVLQVREVGPELVASNRFIGRRI